MPLSDSWKNPYEYTDAKAPYTLGDGPVTVLCDRDKSYRITRDQSGYATDTDQGRERTIVSIPCNRADTADNERGFALATVIADAINTAKAN
jgi:hypothetical protein